MLPGDNARRRARRKGRPGITVVIVVLVIAMLTAIGMFAARSAQLGVTNAGRYRQMTQTRYLAEAGLQGAVAEFDRDPTSKLMEMRMPPPAGLGIRPCADIPAVAPVAAGCVKIGLDAVQTYQERANGNGGASIMYPLFRARTATEPGSFGNVYANGNFAVEFTNERPVEPPPAGMAIGGGGTMKFKAVTARVVGQMIPLAADGTEVDITDTAALAQYGHMSSLQSLRAEVIVGPVP